MIDEMGIRGLSISPVWKNPSELGCTKQIRDESHEHMKTSTLLLKITAVVCCIGVLCAAVLVVVGSLVFNKIPDNMRAVGALPFDFGLRVAAEGQKQSAMAEMARTVTDEIKKLPNIKSVEITRSTDTWVKIRVVAANPDPSFAEVSAVVDLCTPDAYKEETGVQCEVVTEQGSKLTDAGQPLPESERIP